MVANILGSIGVLKALGGNMISLGKRGEERIEVCDDEHRAAGVPQAVDVELPVHRHPYLYG